MFAGAVGRDGSGKWRVHAGADARGRPSYVSRNFTGSRRVAESFMAKLVADVDRKAIKSHPGTVATLLEAWLADIAPSRAAYTMREHRRGVERNIVPALGSVRLDRLITAWGAHERLRYADLPPTVLVVVTHDEVRLFEWSFSSIPRLRASWPKRSFTAEKLHLMGEVGVRVITHEGRVARLSGRSGPLHGRTGQLIEAIVAHSVTGNC